MAGESASDPINEFLGSAHIFSYAVGRVLEKEFWREASGENLSVSQLKLLKLVNLSGVHTIGDVASFLGISNAAASKAVDKLARRMLIRRSEGEADRRAINLTLTSAGRRLLEAYDSATRIKLTEIFAQVSSEELQQVSNLLDRLSLSVINHNAKSDEICVQCGIYFRDHCIFRQELGRRCLYLRQKTRSGQSPES
jgi:DNA-binding MarR family transcriptional regulator